MVYFAFHSHLPFNQQKLYDLLGYATLVAILQLPASIMGIGLLLFMCIIYKVNNVLFDELCKALSHGVGFKEEFALSWSNYRTIYFMVFISPI